LPSPNFFLVTVSSFLVDSPGASLGAWIELRRCSSQPFTTSRLIAEFHLPEFRDPAEHYLGAMDCYTSQPFGCRLWNGLNENIFPFSSELVASVHVLHIWYKCRPDARPTRQSSSRVYLIISNTYFHNMAEWSERDDLIDGISFPIRKAWDDWAPWWTTVWHYEDLGLLSGSVVRTLNLSRCLPHVTERRQFVVAGSARSRILRTVKLKFLSSTST
jgi:hypothetical protein